MFFCVLQSTNLVIQIGLTVWRPSCLFVPFPFSVTSTSRPASVDHFATRNSHRKQCVLNLRNHASWHFREQ